MSAGLVPELLVLDVTASRRFYVELLGFDVAYERPEEGFVYLARGRAELMLERYDPDGWVTAPMEPPFGRGISFEIEAPDTEALHDRLQAAGVDLFRPLHDAWYRRGDVELGNRQFLVQDPDGYLLRFAADLGSRPVTPNPLA